MPSKKRVFSIVLFALFACLVAPRLAAASACYPNDGSETLMCSLETPRPTFAPPERRPGSILTGAVYGWVEDYARFYAAPDPGAERRRTASSGFFYGPAENSVRDDEGNLWYHVWDNWLPARYFHVVEASQFAGVEVNGTPRRPFGWILREVEPRPEPGVNATMDAPPLQRYDFVQIYGSAMGVDRALWYDVGDGRWVRYNAVALQQVRARPHGVEADEYWVDVDLTQQSFAAYEGDRLVYAGLISSGLPRWPTRRGLFRVWQRHLETPMAGGQPADDFYYIEAVPHTMYFDGDIALHGAYWHDDFGRPKSHGCVNMPPRAAEWIYDWSQHAPGDLRVWVHASNYTEFLQ